MEETNKQTRNSWGHSKNRVPVYPNGCYKHPDCDSCPFEDCECPTTFATTGGIKKEDRIAKGMQSKEVLNGRQG